MHDELVVFFWPDKCCVAGYLFQRLGVSMFGSMLGGSDQCWVPLGMSDPGNKTKKVGSGIWTRDLLHPKQESYP